MVEGRDDTRIPFTVADRLALQRIQELLEIHVEEWSAAAEWVRMRKRSEALLWSIWTVVAVAGGWVINLFFWHRR